MVDETQLNDSDKRILFEFGERIARVFISRGLSPEDPYVEKAKQFILKNSKMTGNSVSDTVRNFSNLEALADQIAGPSYSEDIDPTKNRKAFKMFSYGCLSFILIFIVLLTIGIKTLTPIYEFDEETNTLKLFGGSIELEEGIDYQIDVKSQDMSFGEEPIVLEGNFPLKNEIEEIYISGESVDFEIKESKFDFIYKCKSSDTPKEIITKKDKKLIVTFENKTRCKISLPPTSFVELNVNSGVVKFLSLPRSVGLKIVNGAVYLSVLEEDDVAMDLTVKRGLIHGPFEKYQRDAGSSKIRVFLENGVIYVMERSQ